MNHKQEPTANARAGAQAAREHYVALIQAGFTEHQACLIIGTAVGTMAKESE